MTIGAVDLDLVHRRAHRLDGGAVRLVAVAAAHEPRRRDRRRLGDAHHLEREQRFHVGLPRQWRKWRRPVKTIARWWRSATSMAISSRTRAAGLDDGRDAALGGQLDRVGEREVGVRGEAARAWPARRPGGGRSRPPPAGWPGPRPMPTSAAFRARTIALLRDVADRAPGEQQVGQLLERRPALRDDVQLGAVHVDPVERLHEQAAADPLEVEVGDAVVGEAVGRRRPARPARRGRLLGEDRPRLVRVARRDDRLVGVAGDQAGRLAVELAVDADDRRRRRSTGSVSSALR